MFTDLLVIVVYFLAIFCIGIYAGRRQNSLTDYALGNRSLPWWAILASILAAEISAFWGLRGKATIPATSRTPSSASALSWAASSSASSSSNPTMTTRWSPSMNTWKKDSGS